MILGQNARRFASRVAAPFALLLLTAGCGGGGGSAPNSTSNIGPTIGSGIPQPNVVPLPADGSVVISNLTASSVTLSGNVPVLKSGSVIAGGPAPGIMRKVLSAVQAGNVITVQTADATLSDVFKQLNISYSGPVELENPSALPAGMSVLSGTRLTPNLPSEPHSSGPSKSFNLDKVIVSTSTSASVTLTGTATIRVNHLTVQVSDDGSGNKRWIFEPTVTSDLNLTATVTAGGSLTVNPIHLVTIPCEPIEFLVGEIPVEITPMIDVSITGKGQLIAEASISSSGTVTASDGISYDSVSGPSLVGSFEQHLVAGPISTVSTSADAICDITPLDLTVTGYIYGVAGPYVDIECPKYTVGLHTPPNPPLTIDATIDGGVGLALNVFGGVETPRIPIAGKTFRLYPNSLVVAGFSDLNPNPPYVAPFPAVNTAGAFFSYSPEYTNEKVTGTLIAYAFNNVSNTTPTTGFDIQYYGISNDAVFHFGHTYTLQEDPSTSGEWTFPGTPPSEIEVTANNISDTEVSVSVSAPGWMVPTWGDAYTGDTSYPPGAASASMLKQRAAGPGVLQMTP